jgi:hypothetical protein
MDRKCDTQQTSKMKRKGDRDEENYVRSGREKYDE